MRNVKHRPHRLCPEEAMATAQEKGLLGGTPQRVLDTATGDLGWLIAGTRQTVVYDKHPFISYTLIPREGRLKELEEDPK